MVEAHFLQPLNAPENWKIFEYIEALAMAKISSFSE